MLNVNSNAADPKRIARERKNEANWLPAPKGLFSVIMSFYWLYWHMGLITESWNEQNKDTLRISNSSIDRICR